MATEINLTDRKRITNYLEQAARDEIADAARTATGLAVHALGAEVDGFGRPAQADEDRAATALAELVAAGRLVETSPGAFALAEPAPQIRTYIIPAERQEELDTRIEKLGRKAQGFGLEPPTYELVGEELRQVYVTDEYGTRRPAKLIDGTLVRDRWLVIEVTEPVVKLPGWDFLGTIQHTEAGNILRTVPGAKLEPGELIDFRQTGATRCDHCNTIRQRNDTYLVRHEDGGILQVGSTCITDFLGCDRLASLSWKMGALDLSDLEEEPESWGGGRREVAWDLEQMVGATATAVRTVGWTSRTQARRDYEYGDGGPPATADILQAIMFAWNPKTHEALRREYPEVYEALKSGVPEADLETARAAIAWAREIPADAPSEYLSNLRVACTLSYATPRTLGIAASVIAAHARVIEKEIARRERERLAKTSVWIGQPGDQIGRKKLTASAKKKGASLLPGFEASDFGMTTMIKMARDDGARLSWFASGEHEIEMGDRVEVVGTIKKLDEYKGCKETVLTRATLTKVEQDEAEGEIDAA